MTRGLCFGLMLVLLVAGVSACSRHHRCQPSNKDAGLKELLDRTEARKLNLAPVWSTDLLTSATDDVVWTIVADDALITVERPSNIVTVIGVRDGLLRWRRIVGSPSERVVSAIRRGDSLVVNTETRIFQLKMINGDVVERTITKEEIDLDQNGNPIVMADGSMKTRLVNSTVPMVSKLEQSSTVAPLIDGDSAVCGGVNGRVFGHGLITGNSLWEYQLSGAVMTAPVPIMKWVFVTDSNGNMAMIDIFSGALQWHTKAYGGIALAPAVSEVAVYVASRDNQLYALSRVTGADRGIYRNPEGFAYGPTAIGMRVFQPLANGQLVCLNANNINKPLWCIDGSPKSIVPFKDGILLTHADKLQTINPDTGKTLVEVPVPDGIYKTFIGSDNSIIVISPRGRIERLRQIP